jgi:NodT family efflux transporter outer membrane factor (OMF) lipoprotein
MVKEARSQLFPTITANPSVVVQHPSSNLQGSAVATAPAGSGSTAGSSRASTGSGTFTDYSLPFDATWVPDLWGRIRNTIRAAAYGAQASAADLANTRLSMQSEVAVDYFELRGQDRLKQLLDATVAAYQESLQLTQALYETGIDSDEAVAQAETQLESTQAQDTNLGILRAQYEHAIATLVGQPASTFSIPPEPLNNAPPPIPFGVPSQLLQRRPDIAASERLVAQANAQIGVAVAAYYPNLTLSASGGLQSSSITDLFSWPSRYWSVGPALAETLFDAGLRRATVQQYTATYDQTVANYRQTVLTAFQQVEDNLASLRILSGEIQQQDAAVVSAQRNLKVATDRYRLGIDPYLNVITAQTSLFSNEQTAASLRIQQITASVQLIEALGGGWNASGIPSPAQMVTKSTPPPNP